MSEAVDERRWWAKALLVGAVIGLVALPLGALGTRLELWPFMTGFALLGIGVILATIVFFLGIIGAVYANAKRWSADRRTCLIGVAISFVILGLMGNQYMQANSVPAIHNISTDTQNPPQFDKIVALRDAEKSNSLEYDAEELAPQQQKAYPFVKPLVSSRSAADMLAAAEVVLRDMGLEVVNLDTSAGIVEATDTTFWFGFKDDVVVRVRGEGAGSVVDVRSVSRVGLSDLGKNAARIGQILNALGAQ